MDFTTTTDEELAEFALDIRISEDNRGSIIAEMVRRAAKKAYHQGYYDGVADVKDGDA